MTTVLLVPLPPKFKYALSFNVVNSTFRCVYRNRTANRYNLADINIQGFEWRIVMDLKPSGDQAELHIFRTGVHENDSKFSTEVNVKIVCPSGKELAFEAERLSEKNFKFLLTEESLKKVGVSIYSFDLIVQINTFFIRDEPNYSCCVTKKNGSDMVLMIEGKKVYTSVEWLSKHSEYFEQIWKRMSELEKDEESGLPMLALHGVNYDDFMQLINIVADPEKTITVRNVEAPIELADYLLFEKLFQRLQHFLNGDEFNYFSLCHKLLISEIYHMPELRETCLDQMARLSPVEVRNDKYFKELSMEMTQEIVGRRHKRIEHAKRIMEMAKAEEFSRWLFSY